MAHGEFETMAMAISDSETSGIGQNINTCKRMNQKKYISRNQISTILLFFVNKQFLTVCGVVHI